MSGWKANQRSVRYVQEDSLLNRLFIQHPDHVITVRPPVMRLSGSNFTTGYLFCRDCDRDVALDTEPQPDALSMGSLVATRRGLGYVKGMGDGQVLVEMLADEREVWMSDRDVEVKGHR